MTLNNYLIFTPMSFNIFYTDDDFEDVEMFIDAASETSDQIQVTIQGNGNELLLQLKNPPPFPTMIFLDLNMPVKNGYEVLKEIKESAHLKNFPVVIFTTSNHASAIEITRNLGASLFIPKPSSFFSLINILKYVLAIDWKTFIPSEKNFVYRDN